MLRRVQSLRRFIRPHLSNLFRTRRFRHHILHRLPFPNRNTNRLTSFRTIREFFRRRRLITRFRTFNRHFPTMVKVHNTRNSLRITVSFPRLLSNFRPIPTQQRTRIGRHRNVQPALNTHTFSRLRHFLTLVHKIRLGNRPLQLQNTR